VNVIADSLDAAQPSGAFPNSDLAVSESRSPSQYRLPGSNTKASLIGQGDATNVRFPSVAAVSDERDDRRLWVTGDKTPSDDMFSELPQVADIVRRAFDHLANPLVLRITAFWVGAIPG
jgi:hypothetical protein